MTTKYCIRCKKDKSLDSFGYNKKHKDKRQTYCQVCVSEIGFIRKLDPKIKKQVAKNHTIYMRKWRKKPENRVAHNIRSNNNKTLRTLIDNFDVVREETVEKLLSIGKQGFMDHLESLFEPGMSWDNYGAWHLDHKTNLSDFNLLDPKVIKKANHYTNIRPMWATGANGNLTRKKSTRTSI
jgi:hypothetical protein